MQDAQGFQCPDGGISCKGHFPESKRLFSSEQVERRPSGFFECDCGHDSSPPKIHPISAAIIVDDFNSFSLDERRYLTGATFRAGKLVNSGCPGKSYFVPFQHAVITICNYAPVGGLAHFYFGLGQHFAGYAIEIFKQIKASDLQSPDGFGEFAWKLRLGEAFTPLAKETPQLQIADFLTNVTYHHVLDAGDQLGKLQPSPLLQKCIQNQRSHEDFFFSTKDNLRESLVGSIRFNRFLQEQAALSRQTA